MDDRVSLNDLHVFFLKQVVFYNNQPVHVKAINEEKKAKVVNLLTQKALTVDASELSGFQRRIGNVNIDGGVIYIQREPVRVMQMGVNTSNTKAYEIRESFAREDYYEAKDKLKRFDCIELGLAIMDKYPTIRECIKHNKEFGGGMAFDKQFSIMANNRIYYRRSHVGDMQKGCSTVEKIVWVRGNEHLALLLGEKYGKDLASFATSCA